MDPELQTQFPHQPARPLDAAYPSLFTVLKEQLGLKLRPAKGSFEPIVIDQITEPSEN